MMDLVLDVKDAKRKNVLVVEEVGLQGGRVIKTNDKRS